MRIVGATARRLGVHDATHDDHDLAARVAGARRPPLATADHVAVGDATNLGAHVGRIARRNVGLLRTMHAHKHTSRHVAGSTASMFANRHRKARANLARQQRLEPLPFLLLIAVAQQNFHVASVGRRACASSLSSSNQHCQQNDPYS